MNEPKLITGQTRIRPLRSISLRLPLLVAGSLILLVLVSAGISYVQTREGLANIQEIHLRTHSNNQSNSISRRLEEQFSRVENLANRQVIIDRVVIANNGYLVMGEVEVEADLQTRDEMWVEAIEAEDYTDPAISRITRDNTSQIDLVPEHNNIQAVLGLDVHFILVDRYGAMVATSFQAERLPESVSQRETDWWQAVQETNAPYIGQPRVSFDSPVTIMDYALPIIDENGELLGVFYSAYDYDAVRSIIRQSQAADSSRTALVSQAGEILFASSILSGLAQATGLPVESSVDTLGLYEGPEGELFVVAASPVRSGVDAVEQLGWYVASIQPEADAFSPINNAINSSLITAVVVGAIIIAGIFMGYIRPLTGSLDKLRKSAQSLQEGKLDTQFTINRQDEMGLLAATFNQMAARLRYTIEEQESTIASRTADLRRRAAQLATVSQVGQVASASLELDKLMADTVNLIRDKFGYYHASIFLIDEAGEFAVVRESTGEVGQVMKERPHKLAIGSNSIVGWVTQHHQARIALNVGEDAVHFNNPLLPETQSEVALPLIFQKQLLGALDVQSRETNAFDNEDMAVLQLLADQIASAIYNARLFRSVQDQARQRRQIIDLWQQLNTIRDSAHILEATCDHVRYKAGFEAAAAVLVEGNEWYIETVSADSDDLIPKANIYRPIGSGVVGQSILMKRPILSATNDNPSDQYEIDMPQVGGQAAAPIFTGEDVLGAIVVYSRHPGQLDETDLSLLEIVSTAVGSAISNARLLSETEKNLEEINRLYMQTIQSRADTGQIESVYKPDRVHQNEIVQANGDEKKIDIPLRSRGRLLGHVEIVDPANDWSEEEHRLSEAIANQAALALENSTFFNQTQFRLRETEALFNLSTSLSTTMDVKEIYRRAARTIAELLDVSRCAISSWQEEANTVRDEADFIRDSNNQIVNIFDDDKISYDLAEHTGTTLVLNTLTPLIRYVSDPKLEESEKSLLIEFGLDLCLEIPMVTGNEAIGVIELYREDESQTFSDYEIRLAQAMANQTATVLRNAQLAAETQSRVDELSTLYRISETLSLAPDLNAVFRSARKEIMALTNATGVAISLLTEEKDALKWIYIYEHGEELEVEGLAPNSIDSGFSGHVVRTGKPLLENQITSEVMEAYGSYIISGDFAKAYMSLPLRVANETIGTLGIENNDHHDAFSQSDLQLTETIAGTLGIAIENQRLLEQTQEALVIQSQQSLQLQAASEISAAASSILDTEALMKSAVTLIQERFALYYVGLFLIDEETNEAWLRAGTGIAGQTQIASGHRLPVGGRSLIGGATGDGHPRIVQDVTQNEEWRPNPILPDTRSELALPMRVRGQIIGALTVQSTEPEEFNPELVNVLQTMADQLAIAIENTRLLTLAESRANRQHVLNEVSTQLHRSSDMDTIIGIGLQALSDHLNGAKVKLRLGQRQSKKNGH